MSLDPELVRAAVERDDVAAVRELLRGASEGERRACAKALRSLLRGPDFGELPMAVVHVQSPDDLRSFILAQMSGPRSEPSAEDLVRERWAAQRNGAAFLAAGLGLADGIVAAVRAADRCDPWRQPSDADLDVIVGVLADRRPPWLAELVNLKLRARFDLGLDSWRLARKLVRLGLIDRPDLPGYTTKMLSALHRQPWRRGSLRPLDELRADPGLLEDEVWRLFTVPGTANWLAAWDDGLWENALVTLLDRGRLLDACLDAFTMDFAPNQVGWYVTFHDRLSPSVAEMATRADRYLRLLAVGSRPGVSLGQAGCGRLLEAGRLDAGSFLAASGAALLFPVKRVAMAQLKLVGKVAAGWPAVRGAALATAATAFGHQRLDVQEAALRLIGRYGLPGGAERQAICELAGSLAPNLSGQAAALGLPVPSVPVGRVAPVGGAASVPAAEPVAPVDDPGELIRLLTGLMEDASDAVAVERAVAGAVRLGALPAAERARLAAPLVKRAGKRVAEDYDGPFGGREIACDIAGLVLAWGTGWQPDMPGARRAYGSADRETVLRTGRAKTMAGILTARIWEACALAAGGRPVRLLAEPESERGAIGPDRLLARLESWTGGDLSRHDLELALLRLTPGLDEEFWSAWAKVHPASVGAARQAYQQGQARLGFEPELSRPAPRTPPMVLARITERPEHDRSHCWTLLTALSHPFGEYRNQHAGWWQMTSRYSAVVAGWPLLCPWQPELAAAHLLRPLSDGLRPGSSRVGPAATAVRGLSGSGGSGSGGSGSGSGGSLGPIGHLALVTGLAAVEPYVRIAAAEAFGRACLEGRLDPELAAGALVTGVSAGVFKLNRVADGLEHASHEPDAGPGIVRTVLAAADALIPSKPVNLHLLLELAARIGAVTGVPEPPGAIMRLAAGTGGSRLVASARLFESNMITKSLLRYTI